MVVFGLGKDGDTHPGSPLRDLEFLAGDLARSLLAFELIRNGAFAAAAGVLPLLEGTTPCSAAVAVAVAVATAAATGGNFLINIVAADWVQIIFAF